MKKYEYLFLRLDDHILKMVDQEGKRQTLEKDPFVSALGNLVKK